MPKNTIVPEVNSLPRVDRHALKVGMVIDGAENLLRHLVWILDDCIDKLLLMNSLFLSTLSTPRVMMPLLFWLMS